jgi:hypothetical protein
MSQISKFDDATLCPSCGEANDCAIAAGRSAESCWCMSVNIDQQVIATLPEGAQGKVCICLRCATGSLDEK